MSVELASAYISLIPSLQGAAGAIRSGLNSAGITTAASGAGRQMGAGIVGGIRSSMASAPSLLTSLEAASTKAASVVESASGRVKTARRGEETALRRVAIEEAKLAEVRATGTAKQSTLLAAEDRLTRAQSAASDAAGKHRTAIRNLTEAEKSAKDAADKLATAQNKAAGQASTMGGKFKAAFAKLSGPARTSGEEAGASYGRGMLAGLGGPLAALGAGAVIGFASSAVDSFAQLEDSSAAAGVIFGGSMDQIIAQSKTAASAVGMSSSQVINAANTFGTFGKSAGLSGDNLAGFSTQMTQLAGDMASFRGTSPEQAIDAIGAAMRGEFEPARQFGVLIDDASMRSEALKMGLIKTTKEALTPQQKVLAAQSMLLKQTGDAQGDFARTSDSTANTQKRLTAESENLKAKLGQQLAPAFTTVREAVVTAMGGLSTALDWISRNGPLVVSVLAGVAAVILIVMAPAIWAAVTATWAFTTALLANPLVWIAIAVGAVVAALVLLIMKWDTVVAWLKGVWGAVVNWLSGVWTSITSGISAFGAKASAFFRGIWDGIITKARAAWNGLLAWIKGLPGRILAGLAALGRLGAAAVRWFRGVYTSAVERLGDLVNWVKGVPGRIIRGLGAVGSMLLDSGRKIISGLLTGMKNTWSKITGWVGSIPGKIKNALGNVKDLLKDAGKKIIDGFLNGLKAAWDKVTGWISGIGDWISEHKGPLDYDRALLVPHGQAIIEGFNAGLQSRADQMEATVGRITGMVRQAAAADVTIGGGLTPGIGSGGATGRMFAPTIINNYPAPEKASESLGMSLRRAQYAMGI